MNWRMLGLAAALLLVVPVGIGAGDTPLLDLWGEASAIVSDVELFQPPQKKTYDPDQFYAEEQLVEGHTVFATIEFRANVSEAAENITIDGVVHCEDHVEADTWMGIPYRVRHAQAECYVGQRVVVTPDPFSGNPGSLANLSLSSLSYHPTGNTFPVRSPDGQWGTVEELWFEVDDRQYFAWATPVFEPWSWGEKTKNFIVPLPTDRLAHNDLSSYRVLLESDLRPGA